jgi:hypothetical protein
MNKAGAVLDDIEISSDRAEGPTMLVSASWRMVEAQGRGAGSSSSG